MNKSGRVFGASLKPAWNSIKINDFLKKMKDTAVVYIINHDKDVNEDGTPKEEHTHLYIEYPTPRKISTVSNLLDVEDNFIEIVKNKKGYLRYLTHMDDEGKYQYHAEEVYTNNTSTYTAMVMGASMSDKEIAEYIAQGRGLELLGVVSASKLRTIQSFMHFDVSNRTLEAIKDLRSDFEVVVNSIKQVEDIARDFLTTFSDSTEGLTNGLLEVANRLQQIRKQALVKSNRPPVNR